MSEEQQQNDQPKSAIENANETLEKLENVRDETKAYVERAERLKAENMLSGKADAGQIPEEKPKEEQIRERVNKQLEATGLQI